MISQDLKYKLIKSDVSKIFFIAISLFLFVLVIKVYFQLNDYKPAWFASTFYPYFGISNSVASSLQHFWVLLVHYFVEDDLRNLLSNTLWLYFFGFILEDIRGQNAVFAFYILSGIVTGIIVLICVGINPNYLPFQFYLGMKAPVMAIATATVATNPKRRVFESFNGGIPIYIVGILYVALTLASAGTAGIAPFMALVGGVMMGLLFHFGLDMQIYKWQQFLANIYNGDGKNKKPSPKKNVGYKVINVSQDKIDELLDKINATGINSLTAQEREWLKNHNA
jgi:membrane associated rhomboid family serine protease